MARRIACPLLLVAALVLVPLVARDASAQAPARWDSTVAPPAWVNAGIGAAGTGDDGGLVMLSGSFTRLLRPDRVVVVRAQRMEEFCILGCAGPDPVQLTQAGVMYGPARNGRWFSAAMAGGVSASFGRRFAYEGDGQGPDAGWRTVDVRTLGLPLEVQAFVRPFPFLGIGGTLQADLNPQATTAGFTLSVQVGRLVAGRRSGEGARQSR